MGFPLDNTIANGTVGQTSNAYITEAYANTFVAEDRLHVNALWAAATSQEKETAILWATRLIDARFNFKGRKAYFDQALEWPRFDARDDDGYVLGWDYNTSLYVYPKQLMDATAEYAYQLVLSDLTLTPDSRGILELKVDVITLKFDGANEVDEVPDVVASMLAPLGSIKSHPRRGSGVVELVR